MQNHSSSPGSRSMSGCWKRPAIPQSLAERLKFVSIFTSNLDEFFMIRVGSLYDMAVMGGDDQVDCHRLLPPLPAAGGHLPPGSPSDGAAGPGLRPAQTPAPGLWGLQSLPGQLAGKDRDFLKTYFKTQLLPILSPQIVDINHPFPHLQNKSVYVVARLHGKDRSLFGIVPVPPSAPEVVYLPRGGTALCAHRTAASG